MPDDEADVAQRFDTASDEADDDDDDADDVDAELTDGGTHMSPVRRTRRRGGRTELHESDATSTGDVSTTRTRTDAIASKTSESDCGGAPQPDASQTALT